MNYIISNKEAWEEAFEHRIPGWCEDIIAKLKEEKFPFLQKELIDELEKLDLSNKSIAQFCCNNGRELLSVMKFGAKQGVGFDIAENMVAWANDIAEKTNSKSSFVSVNILDIDAAYHNSFDFIFFTIGAVTWFRDLNKLFEKVSLCLKEGGILLINDMHPVTNMLAFQREDNFDPNVPNKLVNSYFKDDPWVENDGKFYMCKKVYDSKTFYSYSHTFSSIVNSLSANNLGIIKIREFQHDLSEGLTHLDNQGIPLSYILTARKIYAGIPG